MAPLGDQLHYSPKSRKLKRNSQSMPACGGGEVDRQSVRRSES